MVIVNNYAADLRDIQENRLDILVPLAFNKSQIMNSRNAIYLTPHFQHDSKYRGYKIILYVMGKLRKPNGQRTREPSNYFDDS